MTTAEQLESLREAIADMRNADDCAEYKLPVHQERGFGYEALIAGTGPLPHWVVLEGLRAMEAALVAQEVAA